MPAHAARLLLSEKATADGRLEVELLLDCGCRVTRVIDPQRMADLVDGTRFPAGKYSCPEGHPLPGV